MEVEPLIHSVFPTFQFPEFILTVGLSYNITFSIWLRCEMSEWHFQKLHAWPGILFQSAPAPIHHWIPAV